MTQENQEDIRDSLHRIEQRLAKVERALGIISTPIRPPPPQPVVPIQPPPIPVATLVDEPPPTPSQIREKVAAFQRLHPDTRDRSATSPKASLESTIGKNWTSWAGAIIVVLGVLFGLKFAWDEGWIRPTPSTRIIASILTGIAISAAGQWVHRKQMRQLAGALHGAGIAIVMASFFAAYAMFPADQRVLELTGAFIGVILTATAGIAIALQVNVMTPAVIALLGAYLAPIILNTREDKSAQLLTYLAILSAIGWGLGWFRPRWLPVRWLSWIATALSFLGWWEVIGDRREHDSLAIAFSLIFYSGYLVELFLSAHRSAAEDRATSTRGSVMQDWLENQLAMLSLLNTAAVFGALYLILEPIPHGPAAAAIGLAVAQAAVAFLSNSKPFRLSSMLQSASLITIAAPLILDDFSITIAWLVMAAAVMILARTLRMRGLAGWGLALLALAIIRLLTLDAFNPRLRAQVFHYDSWIITQWMLMAWSTSILAHIVAWLMVQTTPQPAPINVPAPAPASPILEYARPTKWIATTGRPLAATVAALGTLLFLIACATQWWGTELTLLSLLWTGAIIALALIDGAPNYLAHATALAVAITLKWILSDGLFPLIEHWTSTNPNSLRPIANLVAADGALLIAALVALRIQTQRLASTLDPSHFSRPGPTPFIAREFTADFSRAWISFIAFCLINFESLRTVDYLASTGAAFIADPGIIKQVILSILWALTGFALVVIGFKRKIAPMRYTALALLGITMVKILIVDMAQVQAIWRILSFLAVGVLLLAVSYLYHKQSNAAGQADA